MNKWPQGSLDFYIEIFGFSYLVEVKRGLWQHGRVKKVSNMKKKIEEWGLGLPAFVFVCLLSMGIAAMAFSIPTIDLDGQVNMQKVVDQEKGQYLGHPSTVMLEDGKTIYCVYPRGHGKGALILKRSDDQGWNWSERLEVPESWATSLETPHIYRVIDPAGKKRLIVWSALYPARYAISEDDGATWSELKAAGEWGGIVAMASQIPMKEPGHYMAFFHDDGRFITSQNQMLRPAVFTLYTVESVDGGLTWDKPKKIYASSEMHLCEPGVIRSPDGKQIAMLLRENSRRKNSQIMFSNDEGHTWSNPRSLPPELNGDRHTPVYAPDGRLYVSFRDMQPTGQSSATSGDWVAWVGTYDDLLNGRSGQYRIRLKDNKNAWDCAYPAVTVLPTGDLLNITYGHWTDKEPAYIMSVRFNLDTVDKLFPGVMPGNPEKDLAAIKAMVANRGVPINWLFTGDSITHAIVHTLGERSYAEHFEERIRGEFWRPRDVVIKTGISGDTTDGILRDFDRRVAEFKPQVVSVMIGMNDARRGPDKKNEFRQNLTSLIKRIRDIGAVPILNSLNMIQLEKVPIQAETEAYSDIVKEIAQEQGVIVVDHWSWWKANCTTPEILNEWLNDPIHPNGLGHRHFAIEFFKRLEMYDEKSPTCQPVDPRRKK